MERPALCLGQCRSQRAARRAGTDHYNVIGHFRVWGRHFDVRVNIDENTEAVRRMQNSIFNDGKLDVSGQERICTWDRTLD